MKKQFWIFLFLTIIISAIIFAFSHQNGNKSTGVSMSVTNKIVTEETYEKASGKSIEAVKLETEYVLRKIAHFILYASLGFFAFMTLHYSGKVHKSLNLFIISMIFCILYAGSDEIHQLFIKDRAGRFIDVVLDFAGSLTGVIVAIIVQKIKDKEIVFLKSHG